MDKASGRMYKIIRSVRIISAKPLNPASDIQITQDQDARHHQGNAGIVLFGQLLLQENTAPQHGRHAVGGDDGSGESHMFRIGQGVNVEKLPDRLEYGTGIFGSLLPGDEPLLYVPV